MSQTLRTAALAGAEQAIARALRYDPASRRALAGLEGRVLALELTRPELALYLIPEPEGLKLTEHWEGEVGARLRGEAGDFVGLMRGEQTSLAGTGIQLEGSAQLIQAWQRIARELEIDWEEALSELVGDIAARSGAQWLRAGSDWARRREAETRRLLGEYITHEAELVPSRPELEHFYAEVDELALAVDRVAARLERLSSPPDRAKRD